MIKQDQSRHEKIMKQRQPFRTYVYLCVCLVPIIFSFPKLKCVNSAWTVIKMDQFQTCTNVYHKQTNPTNIIINTIVFFSCDYVCKPNRINPERQAQLLISQCTSSYFATSPALLFSLSYFALHQPRTVFQFTAAASCHIKKLHLIFDESHLSHKQQTEAEKMVKQNRHKQQTTDDSRISIMKILWSPKLNILKYIGTLSKKFRSYSNVLLHNINFITIFIFDHL